MPSGQYEHDAQPRVYISRFIDHYVVLPQFVWNAYLSLSLNLHIFMESVLDFAVRQQLTIRKRVED